MPFGGLYGGILIDSQGIAVALAATALLYLVAALTPLVVPSFRQMNRDRPAEA